MKTICSLPIAAMLLAAVGNGFLQPNTAAQTPPSATPAGKGAGPRLGPITQVEITIESRNDLDRLTKAGYDMAGVRGNTVLLYTDADELAALRAEGWKLKVLEAPKPLPEFARQAIGLGNYHDYTNMTSLLDSYAATYPSICRKTSLGKSVQGRDLWAMKITRNPDLEADKPEVKLISTMHGNEYEATEVCLYFMDLLLSGYATNDARMVNLVNNMEIWIVPLMNPDGRESRSRYNANGYDLNRSFPDGAVASQWLGNRLYGPPMNTNGLQPEVRHIMTWAASHSFTLAAEFHTGEVLVGYGYGDDGAGNVYTPAPDDAISAELTRLYSLNNPAMWAHNDYSSHITNGIVRGAEWYATPGCMGDWGIRYCACIELVMELTPYQGSMPASQLPTLWSQNRESMLSYFEGGLNGVRGVIRDGQTGQPVCAAIRVEGIHSLMLSDPDVGDYHRLLLPGTYTLWFYAPGYVPQRVPGVIVGTSEATRLDIALQPVSSHLAAKINFQPAATTLPTGYRADSGAAFGDRGDGYSYGWESTLPTTNVIARLSGRSQDLRYDTACQMQAGGNHVWEMAVANGPYSVLVCAGDPLLSNGLYRIEVENLLLLDGAPSDSNRWVEGLGIVVINDGRLTLQSAPGVRNNRLAFVEISALEPDSGPPAIAAQPKSQTVVAGIPLTLSVGAWGTGPLSYQWLYNGVPLAGATNYALTLASTALQDSGDYSVVVSNALGVTNSVATLTVVPTVITAQSQSTNVWLGSNITLSVTATSTVPVSCQWRLNGSDIAGATSFTLTLTNFQLADEGEYTMVLANSFGSVTCTPATLLALIKPMILQPPLSQTVVEGGNVTVSATLSGNPPPFLFQWRRGSIILTNLVLPERTSFFTLANVQTNQGGLHRLVVTNAASPNGLLLASFTLTVLPDTDADGLPDTWETASGISQASANHATTDDDGDGLTNGAEYLAGTDPTNVLSYLKVEGIRLDAGGETARLEFMAMSNKTYTVQYREEVGAGDWQRLTDVVAVSSNRVVTVSDPAAGSRSQRLYRLVTPRSP